MYQHPSRRQKLRLVFVYALMTFSVLAIVTVLILVILGFSFNRKDGRLEQGGLLQFSSIPSGAVVTLDDVQLGSRTPSKATVDAKSHFAKMDLNGYRTWQKTIAVQPGGIGWLNYARMVPTTLTSQTLRTFPKLAGSLAAPDRKWIMFLEDASVPALTLAKVDGDTPEFSALTIPNTILTVAQTQDPQTFTLDSWSRNDRYLLVKRTYDTSKTEWLLVDREDMTKSTNISTALAINPVKIVFGNDSGRDLYVQTDDIVRRLNMDQQTLSRPLAANIEEFSIYKDNTVIFTTKPDAADKRHVGYFENGMEQSEMVFSYAGTEPNVHMAFGNYSGERYVAVTHGLALELHKGTPPRGTTKANLKQVMSSTLKDAPARLIISSNEERFVVASSAAGYTTYDIELKKTDTTAFKRPVVVDRPLQWLDNYMIWSDAGGMLRYYEFDGGNQQDILPVVEGQTATLSGNNEYVYFVAPHETGVAFQRARMIVE